MIVLFDIVTKDDWRVGIKFDYDAAMATRFLSPDLALPVGIDLFILLLAPRRLARANVNALLGPERPPRCEFCSDKLNCIFALFVPAPGVKIGNAGPLHWVITSPLVIAETSPPR